MANLWLLRLLPPASFCYPLRIVSSPPPVSRRLSALIDRLRADLGATFRQFAQFDLRWSYLALCGLVVLGALVNLFLPHGWAVWPFVLGAGLMLMVNEAADRNGQGVPPLAVYVFMASTMALWLLIVLIFSALNPIVLLIGMLVLGYYWAKGYIKILNRRKIILARRMAGECIHCGHVVDPQYAFCQHCGEDPDPDASILKRIQSAPRGNNTAARAKAALKPESHAASAARKEQALLSRRRRPGQGRSSPGGRAKQG